MNRIPEPWQLADRHFAQLEAERRAMIEEAVCGDCAWYCEAPPEWVKEPCGYCPECGEHVRRSDSVAEFDCDSFKPRGE